MYYALDFMFNDKSSKQYNLKLMEINGNSQKTGSGGMNLDVFTDSIYRNPKTLLYGTSLNKPLTFNVTVSSPTPVDAYTRSAIQRWLFGYQEYKEFQFIQGDMQGIAFNCILNNSKIISLGNMPYSIQFDVTCDSSYAWEAMKTRVYNFPSGNGTFTQLNLSDIDGYVKPIIEFKVHQQGGVKIININNNNRITAFESLSGGEIITIDNELELLKSSIDIIRLDKFNKKFFELVPLHNQIRVENINQIKISYRNARRVGG